MAITTVKKGFIVESAIKQLTLRGQLTGPPVQIEATFLEILELMMANLQREYDIGYIITQPPAKPNSEDESGLIYPYVGGVVYNLVVRACDAVGKVPTQEAKRFAKDFLDSLASNQLNTNANNPYMPLGSGAHPNGPDYNLFQQDGGTSIYVAEAECSCEVVREYADKVKEIYDDVDSNYVTKVAFNDAISSLQAQIDQLSG